MKTSLIDLPDWDPAVLQGLGVAISRVEADSRRVFPGDVFLACRGEYSDGRDFIAAAWTASADASIGWPAVKVAEVEAGTADPWIAMVGED